MSELSAESVQGSPIPEAYCPKSHLAIAFKKHSPVHGHATLFCVDCLSVYTFVFAPDDERWIIDGATTRLRCRDLEHLIKLLGE